MNYKELDENYTVKENSMGGEDIHHPAFGVMRFSRIHGARKNTLFGSSIYHGDTINVTISRACLHRNLNNDWYHEKNQIIEAEMSQAQFAELITSMNQCPGVPVTLRYTERDGYLPTVTFIDKKDEFRKELKETIADYSEKNQQNFEKAKEILNKKSISKADRNELLSIISNLTNNSQFNSHANFVYEQFIEQMDKTVLQAKGEIEAFTQNKLFAIANQALVENRDEVEKLTNSNIGRNVLEEKKANQNTD